MYLTNIFYHFMNKLFFLQQEAEQTIFSHYLLNNLFSFPPGIKWSAPKSQHSCVIVLADRRAHTNRNAKVGLLNVQFFYKTSRLSNFHTPCCRVERIPLYIRFLYRSRVCRGKGISITFNTASLDLIWSSWWPS